MQVQGLELPLLLLGLLALKPPFRALAIHVAVVIGLLGFLAAGGRLGMVMVKGGDEAVWGRPQVVQAIMAALCLVFVILCVRSFIKARRS